MKDRDRIVLLKTCARIGTWLDRSRLDPAGFIRRNRATFDQLLQEALPIPASTSTRPFRRWEDLPNQEQERFREWMRRRLANEWYLNLNQLEVQAPYFISRNIIPPLEPLDITKPQWNRYRVRQRYPLAPRRVTPVGQTHQDLCDQRTSFLRDVLDTNCEGTFVPDLHPDDASLSDGEPIQVTCDRAIRKLVLGGWRYSHDGGHSKLTYAPLARRLVLSDPFPIWYIAVGVSHRLNPPTCERVYVAEPPALDKPGGTYLTGFYKTPRGALAGGIKLFNEATARRIAPLEAAAQ